MTSQLVKKARANRLVALQSLKLRDATNVHSLEEARKHRDYAAPVQVVFTSCRAA
ncbi:MAG: hypothetical protein LJE68_15960 [Rhodobacter sp.]|nr:hypothetical protein [Rhodobacter sp.]